MNGEEKRNPIDPFQIFCAQQREFVVKGYPHLNSTNITSLLAQQWRNMDQKERDYYVNIAQSIELSKSPNFKSLKDVKIQNDTPDQNLSTLSTITPYGKRRKPSPTDSESSPDAFASSSESENDLSIPKIFVISRTGFGKSVEEASKILLSQTSEKEDE